MAKPTPSGDANGPAGASTPRQTAVHRLYLELQSIAAERFSGALPGHLLLHLGFDRRGAELALATTLAGGTFLGIEPDPDRLKAAVRNSTCDFMVNTLDEALRVLKNELRKHTPLSVGLLGKADDILAAMVERGVQPDLIATTASAASPALDTLAARGAYRLPLADTDSVARTAPGEITWTAANPQDMRRMDQIALDLLSPEDTARCRWLQQAQGAFYRQKPLERVATLRSGELPLLLDAFRNGGFQSPAVVNWIDIDGSEKTISIEPPATGK